MRAHSHAVWGILLISVNLGNVFSFPVSSAIKCGTVFERYDDACNALAVRGRTDWALTEALSISNEFIRRAGGSGLGLKRPPPDDPEGAGRPSPAPPSDPQGIPAGIDPADPASDPLAEGSGDPINEGDDIPQGDPTGLPGAKVIGRDGALTSGYNIEGQTRAQMKLSNAITNNLADVQAPVFDQPIDGRFGTPFIRYQPPDFDPPGEEDYTDMRDTMIQKADPDEDDSDVAAENESIEAADVDKANKLEECFHDGDVQLSTDSVADPDGASYKSVNIAPYINGKPGEGDDRRPAVVQISVNKKGSVVIIKSMIANRDRNPDGERTTSSELIFQAAGRGRNVDAPASNLQVVIHKETVNVASKDTLQDVYTRLRGGLTEDKLVLHLDVDTSTPAGQAERDAFDAMSKTPNVETTNFMLADHHQALGNLEIKRMVFFPVLDPTEANPIRYFDMFLFLGPRA